MLGLAILFNGFIIVYSCLSDKVTNEWSRYVSNVFTNIINSLTYKEQANVPIKDLDVSIHPEYPYHQLPGYEIDEIPLGYYKQISVDIVPTDATNKALNFTTEQTDIIRIDSNYNTAYAIGLKTGEAIIKVSNSDKAITKEIKVKVVDNIAPLEFYASLDNKQIAIGDTGTINISYQDPRESPTDEDQIYRYSVSYDATKLSYLSSNTNVATIDKYGVIHPVMEGYSVVSVYSQGGSSYNYEINIVSGMLPTPYSNLNIDGSDVCYENDLTKDRQPSHAYHYQLIIKDGNEVLDPKDFIWESSNALNVKVDTNGVMRGFRKLTNADEEVTITATSKKTGQSVSKVVTLKKQLPENIFTCFIMGEKEVWSPTKLTAFVGDVITAKVMYEVDADNLNIIVEASDNEMVDIINQGNTVILEFKKEGTVDITITSELVPTLSKKTTFTISKAGAITKDDYEDFNLSVRKSIGHAMMFGITQIITFLALYMFFYDRKKWWVLALLSLGCGVVLASISELIQFFIPLRNGTFMDVLIDLTGVVGGLTIVLSITLLIKRIKKNKKSNNL